MFRVIIAVRPTYRMTYIHHIAAQMAHMPGGIYNFQGRVSFIDILDWDRETGQGRFGAHPPPTLLAHLCLSE